jgi:hypothetical protein
MKIGFVFYGLFYGDGSDLGKKPNGASCKDITHCWPNLKRMLIDPFREQGHDCRVYISTYKVEDEQKHSEIVNLIKPYKAVYSPKKDSTALTARYNSFLGFEGDKDLDFVIMSRSDMHYSKKIAEHNICYDKFNFLFPEEEHWHNLRFTTDNFYGWPHALTPKVKDAFIDTKGTFYWTTHNLYNSMCKFLPTSSINIISNVHEYSDVNSFFTLCKSDQPDRHGYMHPEVKERFPQ